MRHKECNHRLKCRPNIIMKEHPKATGHVRNIQSDHQEHFQVCQFHNILIIECHTEIVKTSIHRHDGITQRNYNTTFTQTNAEQRQHAQQADEFLQCVADL